MSLPGHIDWQAIKERLERIFLEGTPQRGFVTRDFAARTIFSALYVGAVEGSGIWFAPKHVYRMTNQQASNWRDESREHYRTHVMKPRGRVAGESWYEDTTREPIRDETLREGLIPLGAAVEKANISTTSPQPRYALQSEFAALFDPQLKSEKLETAIEAWQSKFLSKPALARIALLRRGVVADASSVEVKLPNGHLLQMRHGPSSIITKAVVEDFAPRFLVQPSVLFISESSKKIISQHDELVRSIGLHISADKNLPDIILADIGNHGLLLVFVEVVATDGPINERRKAALGELASQSGIAADNVAYVTAYLDRASAPFRKTVDALAWGSYVWFVSEPASLIELTTGQRKLR